MNRLASTLCALLCVACADDIPPLAPYVEFGPPPGGEADFGEPPMADFGGQLDGGDEFDLGVDGSMPFDMAPAGDMGGIDIASFSDWNTPSDMAPPDGGPFDVGVDEFGLDGAPDGAPEDFGLDDMTPPDFDPLDQSPPGPDMHPPLPEVCNGLDDDDDGLVDEEPNCGHLIVEQCRVYLGFHDIWGLEGTRATWGDCPGETTDAVYSNDLDPIGCVGTNNNHAFRRLTTRGDNVDWADEFGLAFICRDEVPGRWFQRHCEVLFGQANEMNGDEPASRDEWVAFPGQAARNFKTVSTAGDGQFHAMAPMGDVNDNDTLAISFRCRDDMQPDRAAAAQASAGVILGWADNNGGPPDVSDAWMPGCPADDGTALAAGDGIGCAGSNFDGRFYRVNLSGNVDGNDVLGIALLPRPVPLDRAP